MFILYSPQFPQNPDNIGLHPFQFERCRSFGLLYNLYYVVLILDIQWLGWLGVDDLDQRILPEVIGGFEWQL